MKVFYKLLIGALLVAGCSHKTTVSEIEKTQRKVSSELSDRDLEEIRFWDTNTAAGTKLGSLPELDTSKENVLSVEDLGIGSMIHQANLRCATLHVTVNQSARPQTLTARCDGNVVMGPVTTSTGRNGRTPNGTFTVYNKIYMAYSSAYNNAPMARFLVFKNCGAHRPNCIGIHGTVESNYHLLGQPASAGCVRLTFENAVRLWNLAHESGTVQVTVQ